MPDRYQLCLYTRLQQRLGAARHQNDRRHDRYICNPPGARVTIHQHLDIGQGEIDWDVFFSSLAASGFDGIMTSCVFAWEERADESGRYMCETIQKYIDKYFSRPKG
jgi:myo-inositol catabolism protein IolH